MQQRDQPYIRRDDLDKLVKYIQQVFASGDRESAQPLTKQLKSEHITTSQALQQEFTATGRTQSATFAYWDAFILIAERDGLFELHLIAICETIPWCRAADRGNYVRYLPGYRNDIIALQQKQ